MDFIIFGVVIAVLIGIIFKAVHTDQLAAEKAKEEQRAKWRRYGATRRAKRKANSGR